MSLFFYFLFSLEDILFQKIDSILVFEAFIMILLISIVSFFLGNWVWQFDIFLTKVLISLIFLQLYKKEQLGGADIKITLLILVNPVFNHNLSLSGAFFLIEFPDLFAFFFFFLLSICFYKIFFGKKKEDKTPLAPFFLFSIFFSLAF